MWVNSVAGRILNAFIVKYLSNIIEFIVALYVYPCMIINGIDICNGIDTLFVGVAVDRRMDREYVYSAPTHRWTFLYVAPPFIENDRRMGRFILEVGSYDREGTGFFYSLFSTFHLLTRERVCLIIFNCFSSVGLCQSHEYSSISNYCIIIRLFIIRLFIIIIVRLHNAEINSPIVSPKRSVTEWHSTVESFELFLNAVKRYYCGWVIAPL